MSLTSKIIITLRRNRLYLIIREYFTIGTQQSFYLHTFLVWSNIFLFLITILELIFNQNSVVLYYLFLIELFFGILYLIEYLIKSVYVIIPNTISGGFHMVIEVVVIISLIIPQIFGNLAILRIIRSIGVIKIFHAQRKLKKEKDIVYNLK